MLGTHPRRRPRPRLLLALSSLILLASACFPLLAQAESSAGIQYQDSPPTVNGGHSIPGSGSSGGSGTGGGDAATPSTPGSADSQSGSGGGDSSKRSGGGTNAKGDGGAGQQGSQAGGAGNGSGGFGTTKAAPTSNTSDDDGSSPLVPILIAIALLAAISVGIVAYRQRRGRGPDASSATPEAG